MTVGNEAIIIVWLVLFIANAALTAGFVFLFLFLWDRRRNDEDLIRRRAARARRRELAELDDELR